MEHKSRPVSRSQCPQCLDSGQDNLITYSDGGTHCFACGENPLKEVRTKDHNFIEVGIFTEIPNRRISKETAMAFQYQVGQYTGWFNTGVEVKDAKIQIANYFDGMGELIGQKLKTEDKKFANRGNTKGLYGAWKYEPTDKLFITVTEGELDTLSVAQAMGTQWPVVAISVGAGNAAKQIKENLKYLMGFKHVVLALDNDDEGRKATQECVKLFPIGKVKVATWPLKDANEMIQAGRAEEIKSIIWNAKDVTIPNCVTISDIMERILKQPQFGADWPWETMTKITYGLRFNEISVIVGAEGVGKTEIIKDIVAHVLTHTNVGVFSFEQDPEDTVRRYVGAKLGVKLQKPGEVWDTEAITKESMAMDNKLWLYEFDGKLSVNDIFNSIRYLAKVKDCKLIVIDNLKSLRIVRNPEACSDFCVGLKALVKELSIHAIIVSHVNKDSIGQSTHVGFSSKVASPHETLTQDSIRATMNKFSLDWENGRMPTTKNIEGGNDIAAAADYVFALARNKMSDNFITRQTIIVKALKCGRIDSEHSGKEFGLFRNDKGTLEEVSLNKNTTEGDF